jgi:hypothetical protein
VRKHFFLWQKMKYIKTSSNHLWCRNEIMQYLRVD